MTIINGQSGEEHVLLDSGVSFGRGVFETILVKNGPVLLPQHMARLNRGLAVLKLPNRVTEEAVLDLVKIHGIQDCVLKILVTDRNMVLTTRPNNYTNNEIERGFKIKISSLQRNPHSHTTYIKSLNYTDNLLEKEQATSEGYDEVVFFNTGGLLAEGSVSNVFVVLGDKLCTPSLDCGLLDGVVRGWVLENFQVMEAALTREQLLSAQEVFVTNSLMGIRRVDTVEDKVFTRHSMTDQIRHQYEKTIAKL